MNIIFLSQHCKKWGSLEINLYAILGVLGVFSVLVMFLGGWIGYRVAMEDARESGMVNYLDLYQSLAVQTEELDMDRERANHDLDALAIRIGEIQAHVMRLNALGERLTTLGRLDAEEFNFSDIPAMGGLEGIETSQSVKASELVAEIKDLNDALDDREWKLGLLETLLMNRKLQLEVEPSGKPVKRGWITSRFGTRIDPINGRKKMHHGVDYTGRIGTQIYTVASGLVIFSGVKSGYGNVVEVKHGNGFSTRYAHNHKNLVKVGQTVTKGQAIALLGNTGRSTGPHVHFEVRKDGQPINPISYLKQRN